MTPLEAHLTLQAVTSYKSFVAGEQVVSEQLPSFTVITGENGSGKSHLLQALEVYAVQSDIPLGSGAPRLLSSVELQTASDVNMQPTREQRIQQARQSLAYWTGSPGELKHELVRQGLFALEQLSTAEEIARKEMGLWSDLDWQMYTPAQGGGADLFRFSIGGLFSDYNQAQTRNSFERWLKDIGDPEGFVQSESEFQAMYGEAPWVALSRAMATVKLPYKFETPRPTLEPNQTEPRLVDASGHGIEIAGLSSGERVLLQIAMSMYSLDRRPEGFTKPSLILLDEPDAALHPSMVRSLLNLIQDEFIERLEVPVVMTTHSPTTVALAPEEALFVMRRSAAPRLAKATKDQALKALLVGVPSVSVDANNRQLVVVESPTDATIYPAIANVLGAYLNSERSLQFMAAGGESLSNGCDAVIDLVSRLRTNGNVRVWGLIDRDRRRTEPYPYVYFDPTRYTLENVVLDPLALGLLLLSEQEARLEDALPEVRFLSFAADKHAQELVDAVTNMVVPDQARESRSSTYVNGLELQVDIWWLETQGHELQSRIVAVFPSLKRHRKQLLNEVVRKVWRDRPELVPRATLDLLQRLLNA